MDGVILTAGMIASLIAIVSLLLSEGGGTKGIEEEPYYGRKTGKLHTAKKERSNYIV
jgi:hypothetical protein|tara:strand:+ start:473 stop:643 length:171 start_codon:yes stop_codon:yes gene_type:complete